MSFHHYLFYKPFQVLCQFSPEGDKKTLKDFLKDIPQDVYPVGRLDYDSEGLLFLSNDGQLNKKLLDPQFGHLKEYWVQVEGIATETHLEQLQKGVTIKSKGKSFKTRPAKASLLNNPVVPERNPPIRFRKNVPDSWISLIIDEGKNRQVRKMTAAVGLPTLRLIRNRIGSASIQHLQPGEYKRISDAEVKLLFSKNH